MLFPSVVLALFTSLAASAPAIVHGPINPLVARQTSTTTTPPFCSGKTGLYSPTEGAVLAQNVTDYGCNNVTVLYCSGQYYKTRSIDTSVWLSSPGGTSGQLLAQDVTPDDADAAAGYSSYRYNVTICPLDGDYKTGSYVFSVYETETGELRNDIWWRDPSLTLR